MTGHLFVTSKHTDRILQYKSPSKIKKKCKLSNSLFFYLLWFVRANHVLRSMSIKLYVEFNKIDGTWIEN